LNAKLPVHIGNNTEFLLESWLSVNILTFLGEYK
jgi:hypothetical protein